MIYEPVNMTENAARYVSVPLYLPAMKAIDSPSMASSMPKRNTYDFWNDSEGFSGLSRRKCRHSIPMISSVRAVKLRVSATILSGYHLK